MCQELQIFAVVYYLFITTTTTTTTTTIQIFAVVYYLFITTTTTTTSAPFIYHHRWGGFFPAIPANGISAYNARSRTYWIIRRCYTYILELHTPLYHEINHLCDSNSIKVFKMKCCICPVYILIHSQKLKSVISTADGTTQLPLIFLQRVSVHLHNYDAGQYNAKWRNKGWQVWFMRLVHSIGFQLKAQYTVLNMM